MKKKCLILIPGVPFPPVDGHKLKIYNLIKILHKNYDLHIVTISRAIPNKEEKGFIDEYSYKSAHFKIGLLSAFFRLLNAFFSTVPFQVAFFNLRSVRNYIKSETIEDKFVVLNLVRTASYLELFENKKIVFDMVDLLSKSYHKSSQSTSSFILKCLYRLEGKRLDVYDREIINKSDLTLAVNLDEVKSLADCGKTVWLPNGVNNELFSCIEKDEKYKNSIAFFGTMYYQPNIDAVVWFEENVLENLNPDIKLYIVGARPSQSVLKLAEKHKNVIITGFLDNPYVLLNSCFAIIAPMQNGGGIQNKVLETMGMGKINILSSYAAKPIVGAVDQQHFFIADNGISMAKIINDIFANSPSYAHIGVAAKKLITENYTWQAYETRILEELSELHI